MKKIAIVTLFGYYNYGNRLQMYATQKVYEKLGYDAEVLKYKIPDEKPGFILLLKTWTYKFFHLYQNVKKWYYTQKRIRLFKAEAQKHHNEINFYLEPTVIPVDFHKKYDFISIGSDQIWYWLHPKINNFVFAKFAPKEKRITFSPSLGGSAFSQEYLQYLKEGVGELQHISVREKSSAQLISQISERNATVLCDPTMCLSKDEWLSFSKSHIHKPSQKYVLTYFLGDVSTEALQHLSSLEKNYKIVHLNSLQHPLYFTVTPSEWINYIQDAALFVTDSFHGIVFSIIMETPFLVFERSGGLSMHTRISNILEKFGLEDRMFKKEISQNLFEVDFSGTKDILEKEKLEAINFLSLSLQQKNKN